VTKDPILAAEELLNELMELDQESEMPKASTELRPLFGDPAND
jgi:hypothetical protein